MAKPKATATPAATPQKATPKSAPVITVTIKDLETESGQDARKIRATIRSLGMKAPAVESEGFGPKAKYEWPSNSPDLAKIREALANPGKAKTAAPEKAGEEDDD